MREPGRTSDAELLAALSREGDGAAFEEISRRYGRLIYGTCLRVLGDAHAAEDAAQGVLLVLMRKGGRLRAGAGLSAWLHRTAQYAALDLRKTLRRRRRREEEAAAMRSRQTEAKAVSEETIGPVLDAAISALPVHQRRAVVLRYLAGRSEAEAAQEMGCARSSVSAALSRALGRLRERLGRRGVSVPAAVLGSYLAAQASLEVPAGLSASLGAICSGGSKGSAAATAAAKGVGKAMVIAKLKTAALVLGVAIAAGGGGAITVGSLAAAGTPAGQTPPAAAGKPPVVRGTEKAPTLDGALDEDCWKDALKLDLSGYCDGERRKKGEKPKDATSARLLTRAGKLYVAFECAESHAEGPWSYENEKLKKRRGTPNCHVMGGDYAALALDLGRFGFYQYYMFFVNPKGEVFRCFTWPHRYDLVLTEAGLPEVKGAARIEDGGKRWGAELEIPLADLLRHPADGLPRTLGVDLRRLQWGDERGKHKFSVYWTGMANVVGNRIQPQYDRMATWKPLFEKFPSHSTSYSCGRGWAQLIFPDRFGHVEFEAGKVESGLVRGQAEKLIGHIYGRVGWDMNRWKRLAKAFDAPRVEYWDDVRPEHPAGQPKVVMTPPAGGYGKKPAFTAEPKASAAGKTTKISFAAAAKTDVTVAILDAKGKIVRHLAAGVLGDNAPAPLKAGSPAQELIWDHTDDRGGPVKPGSYRAKVSLGLRPKLEGHIELKKEWVSKDKWPTGLDIDNMPKPKHATPLGHHSGGAQNYLSADRGRDEVYVQQRYVFEGSSGKLLRELKISGPKGSPFGSRFGNGEIAFGPDGMLYAGGSNELWRFSRDGKPANFEAVGRCFIPELWGAHSNPHRGVHVSAATGDVYKAHHYQPHCSMRLQISQLASDGRMKKYGFIELRAPGAGVRVDSRGNVYVGCTLQPPDALPPEDLGVPEEIRKPFKRLYGSILKFGPDGGMVKADPGGKLALPYRKGLEPASAAGAIWVHPGYSPMLSRIMDNRGGPGCSCRNARFDIDGFDRLFVPDAIGGRVEVIDSNGNTIVFFGKRGEADASGLELGWGSQTAVTERGCYVADYLRYRVARMKLEYAAEAEVPVSVR